MILLKISSENETVIQETASILLKNYLAIAVNIKRHASRLKLIDNNIVESRLLILTAQTKVQMFSTIEKTLKQHFLKDMPELYAMPIAAMEENQAQFLITTLEKVK